MNEHPSPELEHLFSEVDVAVRASLATSTAKGALLAYSHFGFPQFSIPVVTLGGLKETELSGLDYQLLQAVVERAGYLKLGAGRDTSPTSDQSILQECQKIIDGGLPAGYFRKLRLRTITENDQIGHYLRDPPIVLGQSISGDQIEGKGSFGLFIRPELPTQCEGNFYQMSTEKYFGLTANYVVNKEGCEGRVNTISPGACILSLMNTSIKEYHNTQNDNIRAADFEKLCESLERKNNPRRTTSSVSYQG